MQLFFLGNWNVGALVLEEILEDNIKVSAVVTNYDENDKDPFRNKVYDITKAYSIPVYRSYKELLEIIEPGAIGFTVAYGNEIFKQDILDKMTIYNFHPSYLPYYKGPSPIPWQIKNSENEWGMSCHIMDAGIDTGAIVNRSKYAINKNKSYVENLDEYNEQFSKFIFQNINEIIKKTYSQEEIEVIKNDKLKQNYKPRIGIPKAMWNDKIYEISKYMNEERVLFFAGNRAELGILFPIILEVSKFFYTDLLISNSYNINGAQDLEEKKKFIQRNGYRINILEISISNGKNIYFDSLPLIYKKVLSHIEKQQEYQYKYAFVLGDRIESLGFALAAFYGKIPLVHVAGGNIANVPYFDTNVRHCISKLASLHLVFSEESKNVLLQLGEEEARICDIGNPSFDYGRMGLLLPQEEVEKEFNIEKGYCVIFTYHAGPTKSDGENFEEYQRCLTGVINSAADKIIITYPNHDPGSADIIRYLDDIKETKRVAVTKSLGTAKFHTLMQSFKTIIAGNSSSGLLETAYYCCPSVNIGDRQIDRERAGNVIDVSDDSQKITCCLNEIISDYDNRKIEYRKYKDLFGDGKSATKTLDFLKNYENVPAENLICKNFVRREVLY